MLHDPVPMSWRDTVEPTITDEPNTNMRFILCQDCYNKLGFINIYSVERKRLVFEKVDKRKENE